MSVRQHPTKGEGWWIVDYYPAGRKGKRIRISFEGPEGEALLLEQELRRSPGEIVNSVSPLIKDLIAPWLEYYANEVAPKTYTRAVGTMSHWLPVFGSFKPANVTKTIINQYKHSRLDDVANKAAVERGRPPRLIKKRTVNKELSVFSAMLKWAAEHGHCPELPFQIKGFAARQMKIPAPKVLTPRQVTKMYEVIEDEFKLIFLLMADMGLRASEATNAEVEWIDEYRNMIAVMGKGNKERILPYTTDRVEEEMDKKLEKVIEGYLFINPRTKKPYGDMRKPITRAAKKIGLTRNINPHLLRHTCLTNLAEQGMSPHALQQFAGHESIVTTNKIYTHVRSDFVGDEVRKIRKEGTLEKKSV